VAVRASPSGGGIALPGRSAQPALGHRSKPREGRTASLGHLGIGDRLPYPPAGVASVAQRQGHDDGCGLGASLDCPLRDAGSSAGDVSAALGQCLVFTSSKYTALVRGYGLLREFITPYCQLQNGMVERVIRSLKSSVCTAPFRNPAGRQPGDQRLDPFLQLPALAKALKMRTPAKAFALAALPVHKELGHYSGNKAGISTNARHIYAGKLR